MLMVTLELVSILILVELNLLYARQLVSVQLIDFEAGAHN
jgi:hypothetical protein